MTQDEIERTIEFLLEHHATFSGDIDRLKDLQARTTADLQSLATSVARVEAQAEADRQATQLSVDKLISEMREGFKNLIVANEVTRKLAEDVARLAVATSQRVTSLETEME